MVADWYGIKWYLYVVKKLCWCDNGVIMMKINSSIVRNHKWESHLRLLIHMYLDENEDAMMAKCLALHLDLNMESKLGLMKEIIWVL